MTTAPTLRLALLGDSIAAGQGASRREEALAARLVDGLADRGIEARSRVFAVPGAVSSGLAPQVDRATTWSPDVALVVIGANDVTHRTPPDVAGAALGEAVRRLRVRGAVPVVAPAPDLSSVPHVPRAMRGVVRAACLALRERQVCAALAEGALIADGAADTSRVFDDDPALFSADRFHPSSAGYAVIAAELLPHVVAAAERQAS